MRWVRDDPEDSYEFGFERDLWNFDDGTLYIWPVYYLTSRFKAGRLKGWRYRVYPSGDETAQSISGIKPTKALAKRAAEQIFSQRRRAI